MKNSEIKLFTIVMITITAILTGCNDDKTSQTADSAPVAALNVKAMHPVNRDFVFSLDVQGTVEAKNKAAVSARISGNLDEIWVDEGDIVVAGETKLFQIDPVNAQNQVVIAEQALAVAKSGLAVSEASLLKINAEAAKASIDFARYERLHKDGRVTDNEFERSQTANAQASAGIAVAKAQIELSKQQAAQAEAQLAIARKQLSDSLITAPISGVICTRNADRGEYISPGKPILSIVDTNALEVAAFIPAQYFTRVTPGVTKMHVSTTDSKTVATAVAYKSPVVNTTLRTFEIKGNVSGSAELAPGMLADISLVFDSCRGIGVPVGAILERNGKRIVFVVSDGKAVPREVTTRYQNDGLLEVVSGLSETDMVIYEGHTLVRENGAVEVIK